MTNKPYREEWLLYPNENGEHEEVKFIEHAALLAEREKFAKLVEAAKHYSRWLEQNGYGDNTALHRALAEVENG